MHVRIFSPVVCRTMMIAAMATASWACCQDASAQSGYYTDPSTGIVYQKVTRTVERPVQTVESRQKTVYRPQTVKETKPATRTVYTPVVEYKWEPRVHGRWNPFQRPTVAYHHVPCARWEKRDDVVEQTTMRTEWVAETRSVPQTITRMQREQMVDYEPVGQVAPQTPAPPSPSSAIASRLRPLGSNETIAPIGGTQIATSTFGAPRIASSTVGRMTSDPPQRSMGQSGMRTTQLTPGVQNVRGQALPPSTNGMATVPTMPFLR